MSKQGYWAVGLVGMMGLSGSTWAATIGADQDAVREHLEQAKLVLLEAERTAEDIIRKAQLMNWADAAVGTDIAPLWVQNSRVSIEMNSGTIEEIVKAIMPGDWRVLVDVKDAKIRERRFQFVSTRTREQALVDLLKPIGMKHQYFFDLKNAAGEPSPLLVVGAE